MIIILIFAFILSYLVYRYKWVWYHRYAIYNTIIKLISKKKDNSIELHDTYAIITYYLDGDKHSIRVPRNHKHRFNPARMILTLHDGISVDITHRHGIPYFLSAIDLGGINIIKRVYEEDVLQFSLDEIPHH